MPVPWQLFANAGLCCNNVNYDVHITHNVLSLQLLHAANSSSLLMLAAG